MFTRIEQKKVFLEILTQVKGQLYAGTLRAGDRLPSERELAEQFGVSRAAVREAIRAFEILGLVRCVQGGGNYIADDLRDCLVEPMSFMFALGGGDIGRVQEFRQALEAETALLAAQNCSAEQAVELAELCAQLDSEHDEQKRADLDRIFHYRIAEIAGNPLILSTLNAVSSLIETIITGIRVSLINDPGEIQCIDAQHAAIAAAIASGDCALAEQRMREHMDLIMQYIVKSYRPDRSTL